MLCFVFPRDGITYMYPNTRRLSNITDQLGMFSTFIVPLELLVFEGFRNICRNVKQDYAHQKYYITALRHAYFIFLHILFLFFLHIKQSFMKKPIKYIDKI